MNRIWLNQDEQRLFGQQLPSEVTERLQQASGTSNFDPKGAEKQLWNTLHMFPHDLAIYIVIYKYYLHQVRLAEAHQTLRQAMLAAAEAGGFPADWGVLSPLSTDWHSTKLPQRLYLHCLTELGIVLQRMGNNRDYYRVVEKSYELTLENHPDASRRQMKSDEAIKPE